MSKDPQSDQPPWRKVLSVLANIIQFPFYFLDDVWDLLQVSGGQLGNGIISLVIGCICYCGMAVIEANRLFKKIVKLVQDSLAPLRDLRLAMNAYALLLCGAIFGCGTLMFLKWAVPALISSATYAIANFVGSGVFLALGIFSILTNRELYAHAKQALTGRKQSIYRHIQEDIQHQSLSCQEKQRQSNLNLNALTLAGAGSKSMTKPSRCHTSQAGDLAQIPLSKPKRQDHNQKLSVLKIQYENERKRVHQYREKLFCSGIETLGYSLAFIGFVTGCVPLTIVGVTIGFLGKFILPRLPAVIGMIEKALCKLGFQVELEKNALERFFVFIGISPEPSVETVIAEAKRQMSHQNRRQVNHPEKALPAQRLAENKCEPVLPVALNKQANLPIPIPKGSPIENQEVHPLSVSSPIPISKLNASQHQGVHVASMTPGFFSEKKQRVSPEYTSCYSCSW